MARGGSSFWGRSAESARLGRALAAAALGPVLVVVSGESGIGTTRLVEECAAGAEARGHTVLRGACWGITASIAPLVPLREALAGRDPVARDRLEHCDSGVQLLAVHRELLDLAAGAPRPAVLVLEDVHRADAATLEVLGRVLRGTQPTRLLVLATARAGDDAVPEWEPVLAEWDRAGVERIELGPLPAPAIGAILRAGGVPEPDVAGLAARVGGNPFLAEQLAAGHGTLPAAVHDRLTGMVERLDAPVRSLVQLLAIGGELGEQTLLAAWPHEPAELAGALRAAIRRRLVEADGQRRHRLRTTVLRDAVLDAVPAVDGDRVRDRLARAVATVHAGADELSPAGQVRAHAELAWHYERSARAGAALEHSVAAATAADAMDAPAVARTHLARAVRLAQGGAASAVHPADLHEQLARAEFACGDPARAAEHVLLAIQQVDGAAEPVHLGRLLEEQATYLWTSDPAQAAAAVRAAGRAVELTAGAPTPLRAQVAGTWARLLAFTRGGTDEATAAAREAVALGDAAGDPAVRSRAHSTLGITCEARGDLPGALASMRTSRAQAAAAGELSGLMRATQNLAVIDARCGRFGDTVPLLAEVEERARRERVVGYPYQGVLGTLVIALAYQLRLDEAERVLRAAAPALGPDRASVELLLAEAMVTLRRGDLPGTRRLLARARTSATTPDAELAVLVESASADAWAGRTGPARERVAEITRLLDAEPDLPTPAAALWVAHRVEADAGRADAGARANVARLAARPIQDTSPFDRAILATAEAEAQRRGPDDAAKAFTVAAEHWSDLGGCLHELHYCRIRAAGPDTADVLAAAREVAENAGAALLAALARDAASRPAPAPATPDPLAVLTAREREVLALVGAGLTNRRIARTLVISERTAAHHVSNLMRKLDVGSRVEAATLAQRAGL